MICPTCRGLGHINTQGGEQTCYNCGGTGQVEQRAETPLAVKVRSIVCSQCQGKGTVSECIPHVKEPDTVTCPQCGGNRKINVMVPDEG